MPTHFLKNENVYSDDITKLLQDINNKHFNNSTNSTEFNSIIFKYNGSFSYSFKKQILPSYPEKPLYAFIPLKYKHETLKDNNISYIVIGQQTFTKKWFRYISTNTPIIPIISLITDEQKNHIARISGFISCLKDSNKILLTINSSSISCVCNECKPEVHTKSVVKLTDAINYNLLQQEVSRVETDFFWSNALKPLDSIN